MPLEEMDRQKGADGSCCARMAWLAVVKKLMALGSPASPASQVVSARVSGNQGYEMIRSLAS